MAEQEKSLPLSSDGLLPGVSEGAFLSPLRIFSLDLASTLIQYDLTLILTLITLKRPYFKIRSHSEVLGGHEFLEGNIQHTIVGSGVHSKFRQFSSLLQLLFSTRI